MVVAVGEMVVGMVMAAANSGDGHQVKSGILCQPLICV
jgi:hypothetical protein